MTTVTNKNGIEFDIDAIATDLNNKVDLDGTNATYPHVVSRTANNDGGVVEIWSDGYCVQTGLVTTGGTVTLSQPYKDTNYVITIGTAVTGTGSGLSGSVYYSKTASSFYFYKDYVSANRNTGGCWRTEGYIR